MPLRLLLDENISYVIADQLRQHLPDRIIESIHRWKGGSLRSQPDKVLLLAAKAENLTLVTYDLKTIPEVLIELSAENHHHAGVIFVDDRTIASSDFGSLTRALLYFLEAYQESDWLDRVLFLHNAQS